jgi:hypothetical protein
MNCFKFLLETLPEGVVITQDSEKVFTNSRFEKLDESTHHYDSAGTIF